MQSLRRAPAFGLKSKSDLDSNSISQLHYRCQDDLHDPNSEQTQTDRYHICKYILLQ